MVSFLSSRKGFEVAIGTVVVLILGVAILAGGVLLLKQLLGSSGESLGELDSKVRDQLDQLTNEGRLVAVAPSHVATIPAKSVKVGGVVQNVLDTTQTFTVTVTGKDATSVALPASWQIAYAPTLDIAREQSRQFAILVTPPSGAAPGEYLFIVEVTYPGSLGPVVYDSKRQFSLTVQ